MAEQIPEAFLDLAQKKSFLSLATLMPDGRPHVTPVWWRYDAPYVVINTSKDRVKYSNLKHDPRVAIEIRDPDNPYRYIGGMGRVVEMTEEGAVDVIDSLAQRYRDRPKYGVPEGQIRVTCKIALDRVWAHG